MDVKGQGALEYLLLIGGAVLVAAIVIALISGIPGGGASPEDAALCAGARSYDSCLVANGQVTGGVCDPMTTGGVCAVDASEFGYCAHLTVSGCPEPTTP